MYNDTDFSLEIIEFIKKNKYELDATNAFCKAYKNGDSIESFKLLRASSIEEVEFDGNYNTLLFADGSIYINYEQTSNRFFYSIDDYAEYDEEGAEVLRKKIEKKKDKRSQITIQTKNENLKKEVQKLFKKISAETEYNNDIILLDSLKEYYNKIKK